MHCAGSNRDLATTTAARAHQLHHTGKNSCCHTPETVPSLRSLVAEEVATYILQPVDWFAHFCVGTAATPREMSKSRTFFASGETLYLCNGNAENIPGATSTQPTRGWVSNLIRDISCQDQLETPL